MHRETSRASKPRQETPNNYLPPFFSSFFFSSPYTI